MRSALESARRRQLGTHSSSSTGLKSLTQVRWCSNRHEYACAVAFVLCGNPFKRLCAGKYLEIFGRKNNLRNYWVTLGNEVTGTGLPPEDAAAVANASCVPGAVYGRRNELQYRSGQ